MYISPTTDAPTTSLPTPEPWSPIYDPFIYGDNCNFDVQETCNDDTISEMEVLKKYLAVRDAYPTMALKHTRVLALTNAYREVVELFEASLSRQELNPNPVDLYVYSCLPTAALVSLSKYTYPSRIVFAEGSLDAEDLESVLEWMVYNRDLGYFKNLEYFQITDHRIGIVFSDKNVTVVHDHIASYLNTMCTDKKHFPKLKTINFNNNRYSERHTGIEDIMRSACNTTETGVTVYARDVNVTYPTMCSVTNANNYKYYNMTDAKEVAQCRYTWSWELGYTEHTYVPAGPFPLSYWDETDCVSRVPQTPLPTMEPLATEVPTVQPSPSLPPFGTVVIPSDLVADPLAEEVISIPSSMCKQFSGTQFVLKGLPLVRSIVIGDECFKQTRFVLIDDMSELESLVIGERSFTYGKTLYDLLFGMKRDGLLRVMNCPKLVSIQIGDYSFSDYHSFELINLPSLQSIETGTRSLYTVSSFDMQNVDQLKRMLIGEYCFGNVEVFELDGLNELESIVIGKNSFRVAYMMDSAERTDGAFGIRNCTKLQAIEIGSFSFSDYHSFELSSLPSLQSLVIGRSCFETVSQLSLTGIIQSYFLT